MRKKGTQKIDPEKMGLIAEHGVKNQHLSKEQWKWLRDDGFRELKELKNLKCPEEYDPVPSRLINTALETFFPVQEISTKEPIHIRCINGLIELIRLPDSCISGSPAFSWRDNNSKDRRVAFTHKEDPITAHIELSSNANDTTDISVICSDVSGKQFPSVEVELLRDGRCIESVSANENGPVNCITLNMKVD
jgi:hypothetical protein